MSLLFYLAIFVAVVVLAMWVFSLAEPKSEVAKDVKSAEAAVSQTAKTVETDVSKSV